MMRLHLAHNEKIIERCINNFEEVFPGENKWIILNTTGKDYVQNHRNVVKCNPDSKCFWENLGKISQYDKIIIHYLSSDIARFICKISHPSIYWIEWGGDLYNGLLSRRGFQLYYDKDIEWKILGHRMPKFLFNMYWGINSWKSNKLFMRAIKKIRYFVPDSMYDEYPLLMNYYPELNHLQYRGFFYYPIDEVLGENYNSRYSKDKNIIVGNSASLTGNHSEVFQLLSNLDLFNRKVIVPLSYGPKLYVDYVVERGEKLLQDRFEPIVNYMSLQDYNTLLESANIFIYNNYRQEAVGNILVALYLGGKVFLNKRNPLLKFYKSIGLHLFEIDDLYAPDAFASLSSDSIEENRSLLMKTYSRERLLTLIRTNM